MHLHGKDVTAAGADQPDEGGQGLRVLVVCRRDPAGAAEDDYGLVAGDRHGPVDGTKRYFNVKR